MQVEHGRYSPLVQYAGPRAGGIAGQSKVQQPPRRRAEGVAAEAHVDN